MHIEPGLVDDAKVVLSYATAAASLAYSGKLAIEATTEKGLPSVGLRSAIAATAVFSFFELLPHYPVGVSEVHLILGLILFLVLGAAPTALGLAIGLLIQGLFFEPADIPQYGMNVTTLLVPLFGLQFLSKRVIAADTPYVELKYRQAFALSIAYQGGVVAWVAFWAFYGTGTGAQNIHAVTTFGAAYMIVVLIEPLVDLVVLAIAKAFRDVPSSRLVAPRLFYAAS